MPFASSCKACALIVDLRLELFLELEGAIALGRELLEPLGGVVDLCLLCFSFFQCLLEGRT